MTSFRYPVLGVVDRASRLNAYVAWNMQDLHTCPLHEHLRSKRARHTLIDAEGSTFNVRSSRLAGLDWLRIRTIGLPTQVLSALLSFGNIPVRVVLECEETASFEFGALQEILLRALAQRPGSYTFRKSEGAVRTSIERARTFPDLACAIASVVPDDHASHGVPGK